jgi:hypothetical protein
LRFIIDLKSSSIIDAIKHPDHWKHGHIANWYYNGLDVHGLKEALKPILKPILVIVGYMNYLSSNLALLNTNSHEA